jgi:hypothetical protein
VVEASDGTEIEIEWEDFVRVDFVPAPAGTAAPATRRLHGTLRTRGGAQWTGFVAWDLDEALMSDILDGDAPDGARRRIAFSDVSRIARDSRSSVRVTLTGGQELVLRGTNDVDDDIRGIEIDDPSFGRVIAGWDELVSLELHPRTQPAVAKADYVTGGRLHGTVVASDGRSVSGSIRWDNDEEHVWDVLDGRLDDVDVSVELARVRSIERSGESARVSLRDGRVFTLAGDEELGDLGEANRGVFVTPASGETVLVRWRNLVRATFDP